MKRSTSRRTKLIGRLCAVAGVVVFALGVTGVPSAAAPGHSNSGNSQNGNGNGNAGGNPDNDDNGGPGGNAGNGSGNNGCGVGNGGGNGSNGVGGGTGQNCPGGGSDPGSGGEGTDSGTSGDSGDSSSPGSGVTSPGPAGSEGELASGPAPGFGTADPEVLGEVVGSPGSVNRGGADPAGTAQAPEELAFTGPAMALPMAFSGLGMMVGGAALTVRTRRRPGASAWTNGHSLAQPVGFLAQGDERLFGGHPRGEADLASPVCGWRARPLSLPSDGLGEARTGEA